MRRCWVFLLAWLVWQPVAWSADVLLMQDGRRMVGTAASDTRDRLMFVSPEGGQRLFLVPEVARLARGHQPARPPAFMVQFTDGTRLAAAGVAGQDGGMLSITPVPGIAAPQGALAVPTAVAAAITLPPGVPAGLPAATERGVLLAGGDFLPGDVRLTGDTVEVQNAIFGKQTLKLEPGTVRGVVLGRQRDAAGPWLVTLADGSRLTATKVGTDGGGLVLSTPRLGQLNVPMARLATLTYRPAEALWLTEAQLEAAEGGPEPAAARVLFAGTHARVPAVLRGVPAVRSVALAGGTTSVWRVPEGVRSFAVTAGVPAGLMPTGGAVVVLLADGKEVARTGVLRSTSQAEPLGCDVTGVKQLSVRVEAVEGLATPEVLLTDALFLPPG